MKLHILPGATVVAIALGMFSFMAESHAEPRKLALLAGCTTYPNLKAELQLEGPANDVHLLQMLLTTRLGFDKTSVTVLTEEEGDEAHSPTRANIEKGFRDLAAAAEKDDQVIILMAGHGSQQPDVNPSPSDPEPDGLDEIFLPRDAAKWNSAKSTVENAITDDEIRAWILAILKKGAHVCAMMDACHSGSMVRGADVERLRQVAPEALIPADVLKAARASAEARAPIAPADVPAADDLTAMPNWVAIYAAQSTEPTVERLLPPRGGEGKMYGLLTFTITQILLNAREPISYADLGRRIRAQYASWGRTFPTPLVEGTDIDREVFGVKELTKPQPIAFTRAVVNSFPQLHIDRGSLAGMREGTILSLWPPPGETRGEKPIGYVKVRTARATESDVSPCDYAGQTAPEQLPASGVCEIAEVASGGMKLAISAESEAGKSPEIIRALTLLTKDPASGFIDAAGKPDWIVRLAGNEVTLVPAEGTAGGNERGLKAGASPAAPETNSFGPKRIDGEFGAWFSDAAHRISRAQTLLRMADPLLAESSDSEPLRVTTKLIVDGKDGSDARAGTELHPGQMIAFEVTNESKIPLDITLLFLDSGYGITALLPTRGMVEDNRLPPGKSLRTKRFKVTQATTGLEHAVVLAVKGEGAPADFSFLEQPTMTPEKTRGAIGGGVLRDLIQSSIYREGKTRGLAPAEVAEYAVQALSWRVK